MGKKKGKQPQQKKIESGDFGSQGETSKEIQSHIQKSLLGSGDGQSVGSASAVPKPSSSSIETSLEEKHGQGKEQEIGHVKSSYKKKGKKKPLSQHEGQGDQSFPEEPQQTWDKGSSQQPEQVWGKGPSLHDTSKTWSKHPLQYQQDQSKERSQLEQVKDSSQPLQQAWGVGSQQLQQTWGEGSQPLQQAWGRGSQPLQQAQGRGSQPVQQAQGRGSQPLQQAQGRGSQPLQQAWGRSSQPLQQAQGRGSQPVQQAQGGGSQPLQEAWGRGSQPLQQAQGRGSQPVQQAQGRGSQPVQQAQGGGSQPLQEAWGRGSQPLQQAQGRGSQPVQQAQGGGSQPLQAWGRGSQPLQQAWGKSSPQQLQQASDRGFPQQPQQKIADQGVDPSQHSQVSKQRSEQIPIKDSKAKMEIKESSSSEFAQRITASNKTGRQITVFTNFYPFLMSDLNIIVYHYDVAIEPDKPKYLIRQVWNKFATEQFKNRIIAFDGNKNAFCKGQLINIESLTANVTVLNPESGKNKDFQVTIKEARQIDLSVLKNYRQKMLQDKKKKVMPEAEIAVLETIIKNWACNNLVDCNRFFFPKMVGGPKVLGLSNRLDLRLGHFQSVFLGYKPYVNFDIAHKPFYRSCELLDIIEDFRLRSGELNIDDINHFVRNVKVEYEIPNDSSSRRVYRVNKTVANANSQSFKKEDGRSISVADYFAKEKNYRLRRPDLPLLWVGPTQKTIYIPIECCRIVMDQVFRGTLDPNETKQMVRCATSDARQRKSDVNDAFQKAHLINNPILREFGISVSGEMEKVPARVLDPPSLQTSRIIQVSEGVWKSRDFLEAKKLNKWCILYFDKRINRKDIINLQNMIKNKGNEFRMQIGDPARNPIEGDPSLHGIKKAFSELKDMDMVFVVISETKGLYSKIKTVCETQEGILTQCVKSRTLTQDPRKISTTIENILLKVNAKLGGKNHCLNNNSVPQCLKGYVMLVGADVTHPSPGSKIPSVAAVAVSCDSSAFQYAPTIRVQKGEIIKDLEEIIRIHLKKFFQIRSKYPEKIIFFRDGVSEGEMEKVFNSELAAVKRACKELCDPKITLVVVQKRHHTRFYPISSRDEQGRNFNVPVGTCVDSEVVHPRDLDFYLVSHASILGTARPTRYRLLYDDNKLTDEEIEKLAFYLCHMFSRCNRSVSYPSPTYNAHLAAFRARAYLEGLNVTSMEDLNKIQEKIKDNISKISPMFFV